GVSLEPEVAGEPVRRMTGAPAQRACTGTGGRAMEERVNPLAGRSAVGHKRAPPGTLAGGQVEDRRRGVPRRPARCCLPATVEARRKAFRRGRIAMEPGER